MTTLTKLVPFVFFLSFGALFSGNAIAHCKSYHPHHCPKSVYDKVKKGVKKAGKVIYGGTKKRAKIVWNDPLKSAANPLKVISPSIPNPISIVEFTIRHPNEVIKLVKNPLTGIIGMPLAALITEGRNSALMSGTKRIPENVRAELSKHFSKKVLDSVRFRVGNSFTSGLPQSFTLHYKTRAAITFINVIVFKNTQFSENLKIWGHEVFHVQQYRNLGLYKFASMYTLDANSIERPATVFESRLGTLPKSNIGSISQDKIILNVMGRCLDVAGGVNANRTNIQLFDCNGSRSQKWTFNSRKEIRNVMGRCLDIAGGVNANRTNIQLFDCNNSKSQKWTLNSRREIRNVMGRCLDIAGGVNANRTNIQLFDCNRSNSQKWRKP